MPGIVDNDQIGNASLEEDADGAGRGTEGGGRYPEKWRSAGFCDGGTRAVPLTKRLCLL